MVSLEKISPDEEEENSTRKQATATATGTSVPTLELPKYSYRILSVMPILLSLFACVTITWSVRLSREMPGHLPKGMRYPAISLALAKEPERKIGQIGFPLVSFFFCVCFFPFKDAATKTIEAKLRSKFTTAFWAAFIGFMALAFLGIVPLQDNTVELAFGKKGGRLEFQSVVHQIAAAIFFGCSIYHCNTVLDIMDTTDSPLLSNKLVSNRTSYQCKLCSFYMMSLPAVVSFLLHPSSFMLKVTKYWPTVQVADSGGISQYLAVSAITLFFTSYSIDLYRCYEIQAARLRTSHGKAD